MDAQLTRRTVLQFAAAGPLALALTPDLFGQAAKERGILVGEPTAQRVAERVFADGGNAFDAIVTGGLAAAISSPYQFGIGGYGGCATLATAGGKRIVSIDFNTIAPAAFRPNIFQNPTEKRVNEFGWLASGVPGILAGLQLVLDRFGTRKLDAALQPAIRLARDGVPVEGGLLGTIRASAPQFARDPGSKRLYFSGEQPLGAGDRLRNPDLADMLATLAKRNSVDSFYRGDIAQRIADAFQKNGGLVTARDMAAMRAREIAPLTLRWDDATIHTAPLTAGGLTALQALRIMQAMRWQRLPDGVSKTHARMEALRLAWRDRLTLLGDPEAVKVPVERLLSEDYARESAARIEEAVKAGRILTHAVTPQPHGGTINLSAADRDGNFIAITLTHGGSFGARVTVPGLGLTLGHGMSRFDTDPRHPNAPGPGKRPLHNMCPTVVTRAGQPVLALGGRGGRKIPNAVFEALTQYVVLGRVLAPAVAAPRPHTEGTDSLILEKHWPAGEEPALRKLGYRITTGPSAVLSAVGREQNGLASGMR